MSSKLMNKRTTQLLAIVSVTILIGMGLTILLSPNEGAPSPYALTLVDGEDRIKKVTANPPGCTNFQMELYHTMGRGTFKGEIQLEIINKTYYGGSVKQHWSFKFLDEWYNPVTDNTYIIPATGKVIVNLKVCFREGIDCEKVTFTIGGTNVTSGKKNETHLSPRGGLSSDVEYLTVFTGRDCDPFWEPSTYADRQSHYLIYEDTYHITIWNLGTDTYDIWISGWEVWRDVNENGIIDFGDEKNDYFDLEFVTDLPSPYVVGEHITLPSLDYEELQVNVTADPDPVKVPYGHYLIKISLDSDCDDCDFWDTLKACVCDYTDNPDPCVIILKIGEGWNLVSIGVELDDLGGDYNAGAFATEINDQAGEDIIKYVVRWDADSGMFEEYVVDSGIGTNFPINIDEGYYLYSISPFDVEFYVVGDCPRDETFDLLECWNLISYRSMEEIDVGAWAKIIEDTYEGAPLIQAIIKYDKDRVDLHGNPLPDDYLAWYPGDPVDKFQVKPGEAYWIFSSTDVTGAPYP